MLESRYQAQLIRKLNRMFPGCFILKNDSSYLQGVPDLLILVGPRWGMLEVKPDAAASYQPNQEYYLDLLGEMSFASVIYPEIEEDVLDELQQALQPRRSARVSQR